MISKVALTTFLEESRELVTAMEQSALHLEQEPQDQDSINAMFRAAHTIKGSAGVFGFQPVVDFTHVVENVLERVRLGDVAIGSALIAAVLLCCDHLSNLLDWVANSCGEGAPDDALVVRGKELHSKLSAAAGDAAPPEAPEAPKRKSAPPPGVPTGARVGSARTTAGVAATLEAESDNPNWHLSLRFDREVLKSGMDPMSFIGYLGTLGERVYVYTILDALPSLAELDPECCYLGFEIALRSLADKAAIEGVFEFVKDSLKLSILPPRAALGHYAELMRKLSDDTMRIGEILVECGALTQRELESALRQQEKEAEERPSRQSRPLGEILVEQKVAHPESIAAAAAKQAVARDKKDKEARTLRVDTEKLDRLINQVGELVVAGASTMLLSKQSGSGPLQASAEVMARLVEDIRESALRLRMVQIGETFNRFHRVVRDVSQQLDKDINLVISGGDTELDKAMVEKLVDPLMHLVRNSMDHGIEPRELRLTRGKPPAGTLQLHAQHVSGHVVIEVSDDGGGLNRGRIVRRAVQRGLIPEDHGLSDAEICNLIFRPGFSTAEAVTNLSGRGVGMDVVKTNIESLRGVVEVESEEGRGSTMRIRLPLTLAIINGFLVKVGEAAYVVPLDWVIECVALDPAEGVSGGGPRSHGDYLNLRGQVLPLLRLRELFEPDAPPADGRESVVVIQNQGHRAGLVVDALLGEFQTVVKPLGKIFQSLRGIGGSTVLGSGQVALILDIAALCDRAVKKGALSALPSRRPPRELLAEAQ